jgi:hypothetical protein
MFAIWKTEKDRVSLSVGSLEGITIDNGRIRLYVTSIETLIAESPKESSQPIIGGSAFIGHAVQIYVPDSSADLWKIRTTFVSY